MPQTSQYLLSYQHSMGMQHPTIRRLSFSKMASSLSHHQQGLLISHKQHSHKKSSSQRKSQPGKSTKR